MDSRLIQSVLVGIGGAWWIPDGDGGAMASSDMGCGQGCSALALLGTGG